MLWAIALLLVAAALLFAVWPLLRDRAPARRDGSRASSMRALYRDRVAELEREAEAGQLDPEVRSEVLDELGANLLDEFRQTSAENAGKSPASGDTGSEAVRRRAGPAVWLLALLLPLGGAVVYLSAGEPDAVSIAGATEVLRLDPQTGQAELAAWRDRLERRVARRPEDAQSWYLLGISRLQLGEFAAAADAFASARQRIADPNIDVYWLQARYLAGGGVLDEDARAVAEGMLEARPDHPVVLEMLAVEAFRAGEFRQSAAYLNRALGNSLAPGQAEALLSGLEQARSRMEPLVPSVNVQVSAAPGAPAGSTLFVIARPPGGGMPYAVVRRPAGLLPMAVALDDTASMSEGRGLSSAEAFEVVVRLSPSGTAAPRPGDWEWRSQPLQVASLAEPLTLEARLSPPSRSARAGVAPTGPAPVGRAPAGTAPAGPAPAATAPTDTAAVEVRVPAMAGAPEGATLFVLARPPGGGMPYAVVREPAAALPLAVRLDDSASMTPARRLSQADEFEVVVRLSVSGNAMPGPGDWEWRSAVVRPAEGKGPMTLEARLSPRGSD